MSCSSLHVVDEVSNIKGHLWGWSWSSIIIIDKSIIELFGHTYNHVVEVWVEMFSLWNISTIRSLIVITSWDIVDIVDTTWSHSNFREISRPNSSISILSLILREIRSIDVIRDNSISFIPLLVVVLFEVLMGWVDGEVFRNNWGKFELFVGLIKQNIVLLIQHTMTISTISGKYHKSSSDWTTIECSQKVELRPTHVSSMSSYFTDLFFITLNTPKGSNIISVDETLRFILFLC